MSAGLMALQCIALVDGPPSSSSEYQKKLNSDEISDSNFCSAISCSTAQVSDRTDLNGACGAVM